MTKPTARPWIVSYGAIYTEDGVGVAKADRDESLTSPTERDANVDLIVRAVNLHDELLAALKDLLWQFNDRISDPQDSELETIRATEAAIRKAESSKKLHDCENCGHAEVVHDGDTGACWEGSGYGNRCACREYQPDANS